MKDTFSIRVTTIANHLSKQEFAKQGLNSDEAINWYVHMLMSNAHESVDLIRDNDGQVMTWTDDGLVPWGK